MTTKQIIFRILVIELIACLIIPAKVNSDLKCKQEEILVGSYCPIELLSGYHTEDLFRQECIDFYHRKTQGKTIQKTQ